MDSLLHSRHFRRIITVLIVVAVIAASGISLSRFSESDLGISRALSTFLMQQDTYLMHDGDTLNRTVIVPEGTYLVVKSDQSNVNANVRVSGSGGFVVENGAVLVLENVNFSSADEDRSTPVFYVCGDMVMNDGTIGNFSCLSAGSDSDYGKGGAAAICVVDGTFTMNGGAIFGNSNTTTKEAAFGGALRAEGENAAVIINDGKISGNKVLSSAVVSDSSTVGANALGGAIAVTEGASLTMRGGEISDNTAGSHEANAEGADNSICSGNGGGIAVYSSSSEAVSSICLDGGSILNNKAYRTGGDKGTAWDSDQTYGGGIFSNSYTKAVLNSGRIAGNISDDKGGGLFLDCDRSYGGAEFQNTLVSGNEAEIVGGGLWFCPDGEADMFSEAKADGIAVFGNTTARRGTDGAGDDIYVSPRSGDTGVFLTESMPGGGSNAWYQDGGAGTSRTTDSSTRYTSSDTVEAAALLQASAVTNKPSEQAIDSATKSATVVITGNSATYGGGVGSNHYLIFGTPTDEEEEEHDVPSVTPEPEKISINVNKVWVGDAGTEATVHLLANGSEAASAVLNADNDWTYTFTGLDKTDGDGNEITYTLTEDPISGYDSKVSGDASSGFTVTNTRKISIKVTKTWIGDAGDEAKVHLLANGEETASAILNADNDWTYIFTDLDQADSEGNSIIYTLTEDVSDGYVCEVSGDASNGFTVTNTKKIDITVTKNWIGDAGSEATVHLLLPDGTEVASATLTEETGWTHTFTDLDQADSEGNTINYTLTEDAMDGYETGITGDAAGGFTVTNTKKIEITVTKNWIGDAGSAATVHLLLPDGTEVASATLTEETGWTHTFTDLDQVDSEGNKINYTLIEDELSGYDSEVSGDASNGFTVTNTKKIDITVTKNWIGDAGSEATVHLLLPDGTEVASATLTEETGWTHTFTDLDQADSEGNTINYTLTEDAMDGYETGITGDAAGGFTVTNTKKIEITVTKNWIGDAGTAATVHLLRADGTEVANATLTEETGWTHTFTDLDQADSEGNKINYTLIEDELSGYDSEVSGDASNGFTVTNTKKIDIPVTVNWIQIEGTEATVHLLANGTEVDNATLTASTGWTHTFEGLDQVDSEGNKITYTLAEDPVSGYVTDVSGDASSGFTVTNIETVNVHVEKSWSQGLEESVTIRLIINGESTETTLTLTEYTDTDDNPSTNGWNGDFENLPKYDNDGNKITYYVSEDTDVGNMIFYKYDVETMSDYYFIVVNSYRTSG